MSLCTRSIPETWICSVVQNLQSLIPFLPSFFNKARDPKAVMKIETLNATFQPAKIGNPCGLQITYLKDNSTRNIFVYHSDAKVTSVHCLTRLLLKKSKGRMKGRTACPTEHCNKPGTLCMLSVPLNTLGGEICFNNSFIFRGFTSTCAATLNIFVFVFFSFLQKELVVCLLCLTGRRYQSTLMSKYSLV